MFKLIYGSSMGSYRPLSTVELNYPRTYSPLASVVSPHISSYLASTQPIRRTSSVTRMRSVED